MAAGTVQSKHRPLSSIWQYPCSALFDLANSSLLFSRGVKQSSHVEAAICMPKKLARSRMAPMQASCIVLELCKIKSRQSLPAEMPCSEKVLRTSAELFIGSRTRYDSTRTPN
eukprot:5793240-Pyramimonas_sp.AAC.1